MEGGGGGGVGVKIYKCPLLILVDNHHVLMFAY